MHNPSTAANPHAATILAEFERLQSRANAKFERLRELPAHLVGSDSVSRQFSNAFAAFSELWTFQQRNRKVLVEHGGLTRPDIGEIASRIGHLHYLWYLRCADTRFLLESYTFYEAIHARQYYQDPLLSATVTADSSVVAEQQLRYYARFILVCIMLCKKEEAVNLMQEFQALVAAHSMTKDPETTHEWPLVLTEVGALLVADPGMPLPRSPGAALSFRPCCRVMASGSEASCAPHEPVIHQAVLVGYHHRQTKLAELPVDFLRMMQSLEWQDDKLLASEAGISDAAATPLHPPSTASPTPVPNTHGSHLNLMALVPPVAAVHGRQDSLSQDTALLQQPGSARSQASWPPSTIAQSVSVAQRNPTKTLLYRTKAAPALAALHNAVTTIPDNKDSILLLYLSCSSVRQRLSAANTNTQQAPANQGHNLSTVPGPTTSRGLPPVASMSCLTSSLASATSAPLYTDCQGNDLSSAFCLSPLPSSTARSSLSSQTQDSASKGTECCLTVDDLRPLTRYRLMVVADGDVAYTLRSLSGSELGHPLLALLSPRHRPSAFGDPTRTGQLFSLFLTLPVSAMCLIMGEHDPAAHTLRALQDAVEESLSQIASALSQALSPTTSPLARHSTSEATQSRDSDTPTTDHTAWALPFRDVHLRQYMCRYVLARAALAYHRASTGRPECQPDCVPSLPPQVAPNTALCVDGVLRIAAVLRRQALFEGASAAPVPAGVAVPGTGSASLKPEMLQAAAQGGAGQGDAQAIASLAKMALS